MIYYRSKCFIEQVVAQRPTYKKFCRLPIAERSRRLIWKNEQGYLDLAQDILDNGAVKGDRTGTGTRSVFGRQVRFDMSEGFPLLTTKRVPFGLIKSELLWFLRGDTNIKFLLEHKNHIWDEWAFKNWVESADYDGPDMTDFGRRSLVDETFKAQYDKQHAVFVDRILNDDEFAQKYGELGMFMVHNGDTGACPRRFY